MAALNIGLHQMENPMFDMCRVFHLPSHTQKVHAQISKDVECGISSPHFPGVHETHGVKTTCQMMGELEYPLVFFIPINMA